MTALVVKQVQIACSRVFVHLELDGLAFSISVWFPGVDFVEMETKHGSAFTRKLVLHSVLFDLQSFMSAGTSVIDISAFEVTITDDLRALWHECGERQWAEWRYENNLPFHPPPELAAHGGQNVANRAVVENGNKLLLFSGGKDSLACSILLERAGSRFDTFVVLQSKDGRMDHQSRLITDVVRYTGSLRHHEAFIFEDYIMAPVALCTRYRFKGIATGFAETVSCIFKAVLYSVALGYDTVYLGNEAASDEANFIWEVTGESVNHQWGKTQLAEQAISTYVNRHLLGGLLITSPLRTLHDPAIFGIVRERPEALAKCHSCNVDKPWCKRCSKCCYVWLSYCAYVGYEFAVGIFKENLFDREDLREVFSSLYVGPKPFECVGRKEDVLLAFEQCVKDGIGGRAINAFTQYRS